MSTTYWGGHFPDTQRVAGRVYWDGHFPDGGQDPTVIAGYGDPGAATFVFDANEITVEWSWMEDVIKSYSGLEQRISPVDVPQQTFTGKVVLGGDDPRLVRSRLAKFHAAGASFALGLPFEEMTLVADSVGTVLTVKASSLTGCDWKNPGQRVVVVSPDGATSVDGVIQTTSSTTVTLDVAPGVTGIAGARLMPTQNVLLDPKQGFNRYPHRVEIWDIKAIARVLDFAPSNASIALGPLTASAGLENAIVYSRIFGLAGNEVQFAMDEHAAHPATGELIEVVFGTPLSLFRFRPGTTTVGDLRSKLGTSSYVILGGTYDPDQIMQVGDEMGDNLTLADASGSWGEGATLTTYDGRPVWDKPIAVEGTGFDSINSMNEIVHMGGVPYAVPTADRADWGRHVLISRDNREDYQWLKLFLSTVRGTQVSFWLPTYRNDLEYESHVGTSLVIDSYEGDFFAWYPMIRDLSVLTANGTTTYARVTNAVDNANGTITLTLNASIPASAVTRISWLERCRFEQGVFQVAWNGSMFSMQTQARVVQQ